MYSHIWTVFYLIFWKKHAKTNLKFFQYQFSAAVKKSQKQLGSKTTFNTFLLPGWSNFWLKLREKLYSYQNYEKLSILKGCGGSSKQKIVSRDN